MMKRKWEGDEGGREQREIIGEEESRIKKVKGFGGFKNISAKRGHRNRVS